MTDSIIKTTILPKQVIEGAGVRLYRSISPSRANQFDPFLLFDHFGFNDPAEGENPGFPTHPHRGIETVTYILEGSVRHRDSLGNVGYIKEGEAQWMSAGRGILHEEMPKANAEGRIRGFQLWVNLPAALKMSTPRYQEVSADDLVASQMDGYSVKIITGEYQGIKGSVSDISISPSYFHFQFEKSTEIQLEAKSDYTTLIYLVAGLLAINGETQTGPAMLEIQPGNKLMIEADPNTDFLFITGKKIHEEIFPYGPFVMNTEEEIRQTIADLRNGTFIQ